jgi:hypothetical protein
VNTGVDKVGYGKIILNGALEVVFAVLIMTDVVKTCHSLSCYNSPCRKLHTVKPVLNGVLS